jgi:hypothetical protein
MRSYGAKYPGKVGRALRQLAVELLGRLPEARAKAHGGGENRRQNGAAPSQQATR